MSVMDKKDIINLKKRYLIWLYKTTKEELDRIERKFTQAQIDRFILKELKNSGKARDIQKFIADFDIYVQKKEREGLSLKYNGKQLKPDYTFLVLKLEAIEKAIIRTFDNKVLEEIKFFYEEEMAQRILKSTEHK